MDEQSSIKPNGWALIPFIVFIGFFLLSGIILDKMGVEMAFYQIPSPIAVLIGTIVAFIMFKGSIDSKFDVFVKGCGDDNIIIMCLIYILAGAFATLSKASGAVDSVVNLGLSIIPVQFITAGLFVIACFLSIATGTSVGTIVTVGPIAVGIAQKAGLPVALVLGALVGGSMFGDNLSVISDTTIAATRTQNVNMKDKFRANFKVALPAAIVTMIILLIVGRTSGPVNFDDLSYNFVLILPYLFVLIAALCGVNVFVVLTLGIVFAGGIGIATGSYNGLELCQNIFQGFSGQFEIFLLSMLTGGLAAMVRANGGIEWLVLRISRMAKGKNSAELSTALLTMISNAALANNTVSIIICGPIAKRISNKFKVDPRRTASLLDMFSCITQGLIPYGAQVLIASGFTEGAVSPVELVPYIWYPMILLVFAVLSIFVRYAELKTGWNFELDKPEEAK